MKRLQCLGHRLLHEIFRLGAITLQPQGEPEEPIDVRQRLRFESGPGVVGVSGVDRPRHYSI